MLMRFLNFIYHSNYLINDQIIPELPLFRRTCSQNCTITGQDIVVPLSIVESKIPPVVPNAVLQVKRKIICYILCYHNNVQFIYFQKYIY